MIFHLPEQTTAFLEARGWENHAGKLNKLGGAEILQMLKIGDPSRHSDILI